MTTPEALNAKICQRFCPDAVMGCFKEDPPSVLTLKRAFTAMARHLWYNTDNLNFVADIAQCLHWDPDSLKSTLSVDSLYSATTGSTENVPGVFVGIGAVQYTDVGMDSAVSRLSADKASRLTTQIVRTQLTIRSLNIDADISTAMTEANYFIANAFRARLHYVWPWLMSLRAAVQTPPQFIASANNNRQYYKTELQATLEYTVDIAIRQESLRLRDVGIGCSEIANN